MDKIEHLKGFSEIVEQLRTEYIDYKGSLTAEFSTSPEYLLEKLDILQKNNINDNGFGGYWIVFPCETCKGYDDKAPLHVIIIDTKSDRDYKARANLYQANEKINSLTKNIMHKVELLENNILVNPNDLARVVSIALEHQNDLSIKDKDETTLFLSNVVDDYLGTEDERNPLVSDEDVLAKHKELFRLDSLIKQRTQELELIEGAFSRMIPVDPEVLLKLADTNKCETHDMLPKHIHNIKHIYTLLAKNGLNNDHS
ncbi:hypothetical protein OTK49_21010 [Vibrio coralliirubri]|uniref:hypothetical protein n=1 Tax=Vibrio coralliirubri TaxID=1516159 RepID=UPI0022845891|nr:hypothetical protein [Vibrio coralliirubri]MCY9865000.1 hypothetical protein [Vibrio coralliirubri]